MKSIISFSYYRSIQIILLIFLIASTYIGIPLNGGEKGWVYVNGLLRDFYKEQFAIFHEINSSWVSFITIATLVTNIMLYICPFLVLTDKYNKLGVIYIPITFLILSVFCLSIFIFLCIPYILIWLVLVLNSKYAERK
ncbi:hypothetical protein QWY86_00835 [Pedobacter aquatilis]|uniref:hypothetical protein n=1 Tax=Pedobacter aquatilis TaxID=351343 RepID=UPI0025B333B5|nr:hypothetical protein [Pedobacter aquatilis]MDN3585193.1 hypothetical protein [Pedobacter aquatilis]